jgi:hypothetical protein
MKERLEELGAEKTRDEVLSGLHYEGYEYEGKKYLFVKKENSKDVHHKNL